MITHCDVIVDLQAGDTGKGKVAHHLASKNSYDLVMRYNGGANAGHTIFVNGTKIVTHQVPVGIFHNIPSLIGLGCVVNLEKLQQECEMLHSLGFRAPVFIDIRAHVIATNLDSVAFRNKEATEIRLCLQKNIRTRVGDSRVSTGIC